MPTLSKPLVVPQFGNFNSDYTQAVKPFTVNLFGAGQGAPPDLFAIDLIPVSQQLGFGYPNYIPSPNACVAVGVDLYVSLSAIAGVDGNSACAAILRFAGYFTGTNTTAAVMASPANVTIFDQSGSGYTGLAWDGGSHFYDGAGYLYAVVSNSSIYAYPVPPIGSVGGPGSSNATPVAIMTGNSQANPSNFGDLAFDQHGNLWVSDYNNNSVLVFPQPDPTSTTNPYAIVTGGTGPFPVANTASGLTAGSSQVFASPEGVAFDGAGNLWVANNNDGRAFTPYSYTPNTCTSLVQITPVLLNTIIGVAGTSNNTVILKTSEALTTLSQLENPPTMGGFAIYQAPSDPSWQPGRSQFGGLQIDVIAPGGTGPEYLYVNDEVFSTVRQFNINPYSTTPTPFLSGTSSTFATFNTATALALNDASGNSVVSNPGNGGIALVYASLLIGDGPNDNGDEPDSTLPLDSENHPIFWESPNIGVGTSASPPSPPFTNYESLFIPFPPDTDVYVYVNVQNIGCTPTTGTELLRVYWASGATIQVWPASWTEITNTAAPKFVPAGIAPGKSAVLTAPWPLALFPSSSSNTHYCLLARIETSPVFPYGMTYWEYTEASTVSDMVYNVVQNSKIAQCNIYIGPKSLIIQPGGGRRWPVPINISIQAGNLRAEPASVRLGFQLLNPEGVAIDFDNSRLVVQPEPHHQDKFLELARDILDFLGEGLFHCLEPAKGIRHFSLEPNEMLPLRITFTPPENLDSFALRAMQYDDTDGKTRLVGGQTFVYGKVAGITGT
jgi:hypothetical protein